MHTVGRAVSDVVGQIHDAREQAEHDKGQRGEPDRTGVEEFLAEDEPGEDDEILRPLVRAHGFQDR